MDNANSREYLDKIRTQVIENLRRTTFAPSVQMTEVPRDSMAMNDDDDAELDDMDEDQHPDKRNTQHRFNKYVEKPGELSDSEDEEMNEANEVRKQPGARKRRNRLDYRNLADWNGDSAITSGAATPQAASSLPDNDVDEDLNIEDAESAEKREGESASSADVTNGNGSASGAQSPKAAEDEEDVAMEDVGDDPAPHVPQANATATTSPAAGEHYPKSYVPLPPEWIHEPLPLTSATLLAGGSHIVLKSPATPLAEALAAADPAIKDEMAAEDGAVTTKDEGLTEQEEQSARAEGAAGEDSKPS